MDVKYHHMKLMGGEAILWSSTTGFGKIIKQSNVLYFEEECKILRQEMCLLTFPYANFSLQQ
jgi:hypothetical protein